MEFGFWIPVIAGGIFAGISTGTLGVYIVGMRIPFLGVCVSHAALAGAVFGALIGFGGESLLIPAMASAMLTALLLGILDPEKIHADSNILIGILFSLTMGLAFLGIGLFGILGKSDNAVRNLLWGSLLFCNWDQVKLMGLVAAGVIAFIFLFYKEMRAIMFSKEQAEASGINVVLVWTLFLILTSAVLTINFQTVGGLMIYSLMSNPAAAAFQLVRGHGKALALSMFLGGLSGFGGFMISAWTDLPTGAMIVIFSSALVIFSAGIAYLRRRNPARSSQP